jgi:hypothetical protein
MPFVTSFNEGRIIESAKTEIDKDLTSSHIYHHNMYFWNSLELSKLHNYKLFCKGDIDIDKVYKKAESIDRKIFIFEGNLPSYHLYKDCVKLNSSFQNIELPEDVQNWEDESLEEFRKWFKKNVNSSSDEDIKEKILEEWGINYDVKKVSYKNSGSLFKESLKLEQIEKRIDSLIQAQKTFYLNNKEILKRFTKATFLGFKEKPIYDNQTGLSDDDLKELLRYYHNLFKSPIEHYLKEYYQVKFSKVIEFRGELLEELNFTRCKSCESRLNEKNGESYSFIDKDGNIDESDSELTELDNFLKERNVEKIDWSPSSFHFQPLDEDLMVNYGFRKYIAHGNPTNKTDKVVVEFIVGDKINYFEAKIGGENSFQLPEDFELYDGYLVESIIFKKDRKIKSIKMFSFDINSGSKLFKKSTQW